jgi:hypothetical protein
MDRQIYEAVTREVERRLAAGRSPRDLSAAELAALITWAIEAGISAAMPRVYGEMISRGQRITPLDDAPLEVGT